jgi:protein ImuA
MRIKPLSLPAYHWPAPPFQRPSSLETATSKGWTTARNPLVGGHLHAALHEIHADGFAHASAAAGFAAGLAVGTAQNRPILWVCHDLPGVRIGELHPPGLATLGIDPRHLVLVRTSSVADTLWAGAEAARSAGLGAVVIQLGGEARLLDMTASRRLSIAAQAAGLPTLLLRIGARPGPSAAWTRWLVRSAPSSALATAAPGHPAYHLSLLRHRGGEAPREWRVEWNNARHCFEPSSERTAAPLPRCVVPVPADRPVAPGPPERRAI